MKTARFASFLVFSTVASLVAGPQAVQAQDAAPDVKPNTATSPYQAALKVAGNVPLHLLDASEKVWALHVTSGARLLVRKGNLMINSSHNHALWVAGDDSSIQVPNGAIGVVGGLNRLGKPTIEPGPQIGFKPMGDPFPAFNVPQDLPVVSGKNLRLNNERTVTLKPGIYVDGIHATGRESVIHMLPGTYIMQGGDFQVMSAQVQGKDVTIVLLPGARGAGNFSTLFGAKVNLSAPTSGPMQGLAILSAGKWPNSISFQATEGTINGTIYGPQVELKVSGDSHVVATRAIVNNVSLVLKGILEITGADMPEEKKAE